MTEQFDLKKTEAAGAAAKVLIKGQHVFIVKGKVVELPTYLASGKQTLKMFSHCTMHIAKQSLETIS